MRRIFTTLLCMLAISLQAQKVQVKYFNLTEFGIGRGKHAVYIEEPIEGYPADKRDNGTKTYSIRTVHGISIAKHISLGIGLGFDALRSNIDKMNFVVVSVDGRYFVSRSSNSFFAYANVGGGLAPGDFYSQGGIFGAGLGYKFMPFHLFGASLSTGYESRSYMPRGSNGFEFKGLGCKLGLSF